MWTWGWAANGVLGLGSPSPAKKTPQQVPGTSWSHCSAGGHVQAIRTDGTLWAWGDHKAGQLGQGNDTEYSSPKQIPGTSWGTETHHIRFAGTSANAIKTS